MKKRSFLIVLMCALLCASLSVFVACDNGNSDPKNSTSANQGTGNSDNPSSYTVTFVGLKTTTQTVPAGGTVSEPSGQLKKSGYEFLGWYLGDTLYDWNTPVTKNITLEAKFEKATFSVAHGVAFKDGTNIVTASSDALILVEDNAFGEGSFTVDVTPVTANDCGVIFGVTEAAPENFWEDTHYYCALINKDGIFLMAEVDNTAASPWNELTSSEAFRLTYDPSKKYTFKVGYVEDGENGYATVSVNGEVVAKVPTGKLTGTKFGMRAQGSGTIFGAATFDADDKPAYNAPKKVGDFTVYNGKFTSVGAGVSSLGDERNVALYTDGNLESGEITVNLSKLTNAEDDGIIFCVDRANRTNFWEEKGVSYYFFFMNVDNRPYLGKVTGSASNPWQELSVAEPLTLAQSYELKVEFTAGLIRCYVNDELVITASDSAPLLGTEFGLRAGGLMATYENFAFVEKQVEITAPEGYSIKEGVFRAVGSNVQALSVKSLAVKDDQEFVSGTYTATVTANGDSGLVFGLADGDLEAYFETEGVSYYFFYINKGGHPVLAYVDDGAYANLKVSTLAAMYSSGKEYKLTVVIKDGTAYCYVDNTLHAKYQVTLPGKKVGLRGYTGASFGNIAITETADILTTDTLIFGHSYTQLWYTYKTDFSELTDIMNIGIGGTQSPDWTTLADEVATYNFTKAIYMIGINDFNPYNTTVSAQSVFNEIKTTLERIHTLLPEAEIALINVNRVPLAEKHNFYEMIDKCNVLMADFAAENDYVKLVDFASAVIDGNGNFKDYFSPDQLHLNAAGYAKLTELVKKALKIGVNE